MSAATGKRTGDRRAVRKWSLPTRKVLILSLAVTLSVIAWGYLVLAAIDFGTSARGGESSAWVFLGLSCLGATACLFAGLMLGARLLRTLGIISDPTSQDAEPEAAPAPDSLAGLSPAPTLTVSPDTTTHVSETSPTVTMTHVSETLPPTAAEQSWTLAPQAERSSDPLTDPWTGPMTELPPTPQYRPWLPPETDAQDGPGPEVPAQRQGGHPRGKRVADRPLNPDGPRPTGGRRIAR